MGVREFTLWRNFEAFEATSAIRFISPMVRSTRSGCPMFGIGGNRGPPPPQIFLDDQSDA
jgi:hypothetical protein